MDLSQMPLEELLDIFWTEDRTRKVTEKTDAMREELDRRTGGHFSDDYHNARIAGLI